ncbi:MAG: CoA pyrophosphatase [Flavobacteriaceae bacterium]
MDFLEFSHAIPKIKNLTLPGRDSHYKMAPEARIEELKEREDKKKFPKKAGVMALFYPHAAHDTRLLLILRNRYPGVHSGQISFPGGQYETGDRDMLDTALRESCEEVGAVKSDIEVIRPVSELYIPPSNFEVSPFVGLYHKEKPFERQASEVEALIEVPVSDLLDDSKLVMKNLSTSYASEIEVPAFLFDGHIVWGATAMMLSEIRELLQKVL